MSVTLTDDSTQFPPVTVPQSGDSRTAAGITAPFQALADRTAQNKTRLDAIAPSGDTTATRPGVRQLRRFSSAAQLASVVASDRSDGNCAMVDRLGTFEYIATSTATADNSYVVQPADTVTSQAPGRWLHSVQGRLNQPSGVPQLDSGARIPAPMVRNGMVGFGFVENPAASTTSQSLADVPSTAVRLADLAVGDSVKITASFAFAALGSGDVVTIGVKVVDGASAVHHLIDDTQLDTTCTVGARYRIETSYTVTAAGSHSFNIEWETAKGTEAQIANVRLVAEAVRA